jgi:hypothetical protein
MIKPLHDPQTLSQLGERVQLHSDSAYQAIQECLKGTRQQISNMSWSELIEYGAEIGTTFILDALTLGIIGKCAHATRGHCIKQFNKLAESGLLFAKEYAVEVAGFGKLVIEEGAHVVPKAADIIKRDLVLCMDSQSALQKVRAQLTPEKWLELVEHKIRNVGDDILDIMEKAGGHTLEKHVAKKFDKLRARFGSGEVNMASAFTNKKIAINAVKDNLRRNVKDIASWLVNDPIRKEIVVECSHSYTLGKGTLKSKKSPCYNLASSRMILRRDDTQSIGFKIITAFPVMK